MAAKNGGKEHGSTQENGQIHSTLRGLLSGKKDGVARSREAVEEIRKTFPLVAEVLGGIPEGKDQPEILAGTITFFVRDGKLRFSINVKSADTTFIGDVSEASEPWKSIEFAMISGQVSSKGYSERPNSLLTAKPGDIPY